MDNTTGKQAKQGWTSPSLKEIDVKRDTKAGNPKPILPVEGALYAPS